MKNLRVIRTVDINLESHIDGYCFELDRHLIYALDNSAQLLKVPVSVTPQSIEDITHISVEQLRGIKSGHVRLIEFIVEVSGILIALRDGRLLLISVDTGSCTCIYEHHEEISSANLSPAQDSILIADKKNNIRLLPFPFTDQSQFYENNTLTHNESLHKPVGVGWGSKETQFFGLDGRPSQEDKQQKVTSSSGNSEDQLVTDQIESSHGFKDFLQSRARETNIAWRGDGQLIATLTIIPESNKHYLKVWNRRLELQYMSEQLVDIESSLLSYIPNGQFICCAQRRDQQVNEVVLFEKNGLVRDRITLPTIKDVHVNAISWSSDSAILAIIAKQFQLKDQKLCSTSLLFLYTMQNWHYYLKFTSRLSEDNYSMSWHPNHIYTLQLMSTSGHYIEYNCHAFVDYSVDCSTVAVIDSNRLLITPLQYCSIPPPYSAIQLQTNSPIYAIAISYKNASNLFILTLENQLIRTFCDSSSLNRNGNDVVKVIHDERLANQTVKNISNNYRNYMIYELPNSHNLQHLTLVDECSLAASRLTKDGSELVLITLEANNLSIEVKRKFESRRVNCISRNICDSTKVLFVANEDNSSLLWYIDSNEFKIIDRSNEGNTSSFITDSQVLPSTSSVITLSQDQCLRVDQKTIVFNSCTSFRVTENYLVYTTNENTINFILLQNLQQQSEFESWSQTIENGGVLITVNEYDSKVVLQMPRGNLEIIHPRILLFSALTKLIDEGSYVQACKIARRHRVNMNFLVDYIMCLSEDRKELNKFALDIAGSDPNLLCLVITELDNLSTISGRYEDLMKHLPARRFVITDQKKKPDKSKKEIGKINKFCSSIKFPNDFKYLNPRLQSLLKMEPRRMSDALRIVYELDDESKNNALKFILYFVDIDHLFLDALCTYDTNITLMVASASNKDPKQYLAFLDELNEIKEDSLRFFTIDTYVKHYNEAFDHLLEYLDTVETKEEVRTQLIDLVVSKRIYQHAIAILESRHQYADLSEVIWAKYADYLFEKRHYSEACVAFSKAQYYSSSKDYLNQAFRSASLTDNWESIGPMINRSKVDSNQREALLKKVSDQLTEKGKFYDALIVLNPRKNPVSDTMLSTMMTKGYWYLAEFLADQKSSVRMMLSSSIMDTFSERIKSWTDELNVAQEQLSKLKSLVLAARNRQFDSEKCFISDSLSTIDGSETLSSISGAGLQKVPRSGVTSIKTRSSVKSNKLHHKRITLKPGSRHEDIALVLELQKFMSRQKAHHDEAMRILAAVYEYTSFNTARSSSTEMNNLLLESLTFSQEACEELWPSNPNLDQKYSLYQRNKDYTNYEIFENVDFEIFIKPNLPKNLISFEL